ncbi:MAG: polysaccharide deacetylase family protein [Clostridia bacterium]|nr:polysaccharide deacetylase family protein [Clostridia bacterium]
MRYLIVTKKHIMSAIAFTLAVTTAIIGSAVTFAQNDKKLPIYCVDCEKKQIAISFDAAWGNDDTQTLIDILKEYEVPATFFVVGAWVDKYPESVKALHEAGHQIQNHSNTHPYMTQLSKDQMCNELADCNKKIEAITGITPTLFRPPYGDYDNSVIEAIESMKMYPIQWSVDSLDWKDNATAESICNRVVSKCENGSIILCHNDAEHTPEALPHILKSLKEKGFEFVFISDLILKDKYTIDHSGKQIQNAGGD